MIKREKHKREFVDLTWDDLEEWAGSKIVSRGRNYQKQGRVSELAKTKDNCLIGWVDGSEQYAVKVVMEDDDLPDSICTCPYQFDCKHGVALVLEYLEQVKNKKHVPEADIKDERFRLLEGEDPGDVPEDNRPVLQEDIKGETDTLLKGMTKAGLIDLIHELGGKYPAIAGEITDRRQILSGDKKPLINRLRREIREISEEPGWQNYWNGEGYTPDYSGIHDKFEALLAAGYADDVLSLGKELMSSGTRHVEISNDEGETAMEIEKCIPVIIKALDRSSIEPADKLAFAVDSLIDDEYSMFESFCEYLDRKHPADAWNSIAEKLINRVKGFKSDKESDCSREYRRDQISDWAIHALEKAGRKNEIIPLCEAEAEKTGSFVRLVKRLIEDKRHEEAERWIHKGIGVAGNKWPGIASQLRGELLNIRTRKKDWPSVAAMRVYEFVQYPSDKAYSDCKNTSDKIKLWSKVRESLLRYLESGMLPWKQEDWPLPETGFAYSESRRGGEFPMIGYLIDIAILEKNPEQALAWYDKLPKNRYGWSGVDEDKIATAIQAHAPDRAVSMWKRKAENLIAQVKPKAYQEAAKYLRKAAKVMAGQNNQNEWDRYILQLKKEHARKLRLIEILDKMHSRPIVRIK